MTTAIILSLTSLLSFGMIAEAGNKIPRPRSKPVPETRTSGGGGVVAEPAYDESYPPAVNARQVDLPVCIDNSFSVNGDPVRFNGMKPIDYVISEYSKNKKAKRYKGYQKVYEHGAVAADDREMLVRLVYGEILAISRNCPALEVDCSAQTNNCDSPEIRQLGAQNIAAVMHNRIQMQNGDIKKVIYESDQFASTMHQYGKSTGSWMGGKAHFKEMLCPKDQKAWDLANHYVNGYLDKHLQNPLPKTSTNYYFCQHFEWDEVPEGRRKAWGINDRRNDCDPWRYKLVDRDNDGKRFPSSYMACMNVFKGGWKR